MSRDGRAAPAPGAPPAAAEGIAAGVRAGQRRALARAITLVESTRPDHRALAAAVLERLAPVAGGSLRVGISGAPGVGKSTFIEALGLHAIGEGARVAVLAVDPTSALSGGSILGDKTRMPRLAADPRAFIRPSPAGTTPGGVHRRTRESILLCEAAGHDLVIVETVGVGQSEVAVAGMTDLLVLLLAPGAGDELQGIKRGIVELADVVLVNKADGALADAAGRTAAEYRNAIRLLRPRSAHWTVPVETCSALTGAGIPEAWATLARFRAAMEAAGELAARRAAQARDWLRAEIGAALEAALRADDAVAADLERLEGAVARGEVPASVAADRIVASFLARARADARGGAGSPGGAPDAPDPPDAPRSPDCPDPEETAP